MELNKLLISKRPEYMEAVYEAGITKIVLPEFDELMKTPQNNPHHCYNVGEHTIAALQHVPADPILRWTMLLHDIANRRAAQRMRPASIILKATHRRGRKWRKRFCAV